MFEDVADVLIVQHVPGMRVAVFFHHPQMPADDKTVGIQGLGLRHQDVDQFFAYSSSAGFRFPPQYLRQPQADFEQPLTERFARTARKTLRMLPEKLKVFTKIEDDKLPLMVARTEQIRAKPRAAPDHLPVFGAAAHGFVKQQVGHLRNIDAGVQHIHRNGDLRQFVFGFELVQQVVFVFFLVVDDFQEMPRDTAGTAC